MYRSYHRIKHECAGHTTGLNTSVHVISQDQTRVYRSYHRTKHECTGQITGPNTSVQVTPQDQTRVCRSDHRTKHECSTGHITGRPNTSVQVTPQDQTRMCRSDHRNKHECTGQITEPDTSEQIRRQDKTRDYWPTDLLPTRAKTMDLYIRDICCVGGLLAATRSSYSSTPSRTLSMKRVVGNPDAHSNLCRLANFAACSFSCRSV